MADNINSTNNQKDANAKSDDSSSVIISGERTEANTHSDQSTKEENKSPKPKKKRFSWFKWPSTNQILTIATLIIAFMAVLQYLVLDRSDQTSRLRDRAYIYFPNPIEATYLDGFDFDKTRITQACRSLRFDVQGGKSLGFAGSHNCIDSYCPDCPD